MPDRMTSIPLSEAAPRLMVQDTGYMLSFNFNQKKETGVKQVSIGDKLLYEGVV